MTKQSRKMARMTWPEVGEAAKRDVPVLIPMGTLEVQGLHGPMGQDAMVAEALALAVAEKTECLVAPTIPFGYSHFAKPYPGTISLRAETLRALLDDVVDSLVSHGFRHLVFINNHGLSEPIVGHAADEAREKYGIVLASVFPTKIASEFGRELFNPVEGVFAHGGQPSSSLLLHLFPDDVRMDKTERHVFDSPWRDFEVPGPQQVRVNGATINMYMAFPEITPTGSAGDPTVASAEKGKIMFERMVDAVSAFVEKFRAVKM
jgi:creatinine amidohydrolase